MSPLFLLRAAYVPFSCQTIFVGALLTIYPALTPRRNECIQMQYCTARAPQTSRLVAVTHQDQDLRRNRWFSTDRLRNTRFPTDVLWHTRFLFMQYSMFYWHFNDILDFRQISDDMLDLISIVDARFVFQLKSNRNQSIRPISPPNTKDNGLPIIAYYCLLFPIVAYYCILLPTCWVWVSGWFGVGPGFCLTCLHDKTTQI